MFYYGRITLCSLALSCLGLARSRGALPDLPALLASIEHDGAEIERLTASIAAGLAPFALFND